jgi:hypothetical protein
MFARLIFLGIVGFWVTMNYLLWSSEFGSRGGDTPVPPQLVWHKILTAPDASSLSVYQKGDRMGYCEVSTGVGQQMASFDEGKPPPEGYTARAGYQLHVAGNVSLGDFTNRLKFDLRLRFDRFRQWEELNVKITSRIATIEVHSLATNHTAHVKLSNEGALVLERNIAVADLEDPAAIFRALTDNLAGDYLDAFTLSDILPVAATQKIVWESRRTRVRVGSEAIPVYRLETTILAHPVIVNVSTLGEILSIELPGDINARIDEWNKP